MPSSPSARSSREEGWLRFRFQLRAVEEIEPWRDASGNPTPLHWFGLTDGWYWIEAGTQELFRFSEEALANWETQGYPSTLPYNDYQVARFWEDLLELLRSALVPLPEDIAALSADGEPWEVWSRQLSSGHALLQKISVWRVDDQVTLRWDGHTDSTPYPWTAPEQGQITLSLSSFLAAVHDFNDQLMAQMAERVAGNGKLEREHAQRLTLLENALAHPHQEDWDAIRTALRAISPSPSSGDEGANSGRGVARNEPGRWGTPDA